MVSSSLTNFSLICSTLLMGVTTDSLLITMERSNYRQGVGLDLTFNCYSGSVRKSNANLSNFVPTVHNFEKMAKRKPKFWPRSIAVFATDDYCILLRFASI